MKDPDSISGASTTKKENMDVLKELCLFYNCKDTTFKDYEERDGKFVPSFVKTCSGEEIGERVSVVTNEAIYHDVLERNKWVVYTPSGKVQSSRGNPISSLFDRYDNIKYICVCIFQNARKELEIMNVR